MGIMEPVHYDCNTLKLMSYLIIVPVLIIFITTVLGVIVIAGNWKDSRNRTLFFIIILSTCWIASGFFADHAASLNTAFFWTRFAIIPPAFVLPLFLYFSMIFPTAINKVSRIKQVLLFTPALAYLFLFSTSLNVEQVIIKSWGADYTPGLLYRIFIPYFIIYFLFTLFNFYNSYQKGDKVSRAQIRFIIFGLLSAFVIGIVTNVIFPLSGKSELSVTGPSFAILFLAGFNTYAILKHHLFSIKVVASELLTFAIWIFLLIQMVISETSSARITNSILLLFIIFFGILLIRSVINEVRQREKLKELNQLKTEFLGLATHQLRSPLTVIMGDASLLLDGSLGKIAEAKQQKAIDQIFQSSRNLIKVINDLLDVSKIEQGGMQYEMEQVNMEKLAQEIVNELNLSARNKGLTLYLEEKDSGSYLVKADPVKIRQVVLNLVDNAIKYTQKGFVKVLLQKPVNGKMQISVSDSGMGISPATIGKLFEKFSRGDSGKVNTGGSGLGLYLAKEIMLAHGGKIWAESRGLGYGSTFIIELPELSA